MSDKPVVTQGDARFEKRTIHTRVVDRQGEAHDVASEVDVLVIPLQGELKNGDEFSVTYTLPLEDNIKPKPDAQS
jgi:hypothetical protein